MRPLLLFVFSLALLLPGLTRAQTVVEMNLRSATALLRNHKMHSAVDMLSELTKNYRKFTNIRVVSRERKKQLAMLARALRTDFDGSGNNYVLNYNIWLVTNHSDYRVYLAASLLDKGAILLTTDLDYMKGMLAHEILQSVEQNLTSVTKAQRNANFIGIEMEVYENDFGGRSISFFGRRKENQLSGKLIVIEPPEFVWD